MLALSSPTAVERLTAKLALVLGPLHYLYKDSTVAVATFSNLVKWTQVTSTKKLCTITLGLTPSTAHTSSLSSWSSLQLQLHESFISVRTTLPYPLYTTHSLPLVPTPWLISGTRILAPQRTFCLRNSKWVELARLTYPPLSLEEALRLSLQLLPRNTAVSFSGGLDSGLLTHLIAREWGSVMAVAVGLPGSPGLQQARQAAHFIDGIDLIEYEVAEREIVEAASLLLLALPPHPLTLSVAVSLYLAAKAANRAGAQVLVTGQGADELFCGYAQHQRLLTEEGVIAAQRRRWRDLEALLTEGVVRDWLAVAAARLLHYSPYLSPPVIAAALQEFIGRHLTPNERKRLLRQIAVKLGLHRDIALAPKKAIQYATRIHKVVLKALRGTRTPSP